MRAGTASLPDAETARFERGDYLIGVRGRKRGRILRVVFDSIFSLRDDRPRYRVQHEGRGFLTDRHRYTSADFDGQRRIHVSLGYRAIRADSLVESVERDFAKIEPAKIAETLDRAKAIANRFGRDDYDARRRLDRAARNVLLSTVEGESHTVASIRADRSAGRV